MRNAQSTLQCQDLARQALARARGLQIQIRGPPCRGAIVDYCEGRFDARRLIQRCTRLEANEFARLAAPIYIRRIAEHTRDFRCVPGRCQFIHDGLHIEGCEFDSPLPPGIAVSKDFLMAIIQQPGIPELAGLARSLASSRPGHHTHVSRGHSGGNDHRNSGGYGGHQSSSGHLAPRRPRDHQSYHGGQQARPSRSDHRRAPHDGAYWDIEDEFPSID